MSFRIGKTEVRLSIGVLPLFAVLLVIGEGKALAIAVLSLLLHECAHLIAARNLGFAIRRLSVYPFGAVLHLDALGTKAGGEAIAALAGPIGSLVIASAARLTVQLMPQTSQILEPFIHTNAALALLNLLPAYPLDGGRVTKSLLLRFLSHRAARTVSLLFTGVTAALLIALGIRCVMIGFPAWTLFGIAPFLLLSAWIEWKQMPPSAVAHVLARSAESRAGTPMLTQTVLLGDNATVGDAIKMLSVKRFTFFRILRNARSFEIDEDRMLDAASKFGYDMRLKDVFTD